MKVELSETYAYPRELVFRAFAEARALERWFGPTDEYTTIVHELEVSPGGGYRVEFIDPDGSHSMLVGTYREVVPPERLVFSWRWETTSEFPDEESVVRVEFRDYENGTQVVLVHEGLGTQHAFERHTYGWNGAFERLGRYL